MGRCANRPDDRPLIPGWPRAAADSETGLARLDGNLRRVTCLPSQTPPSHRFLLVFALALAVACSSTAKAQKVDPADILYILPFWSGFGGSSDEVVIQEYERLTTRLGPEGPYVKLGFSGYVFMSMEKWDVNRTDSRAIRAALASTIRQIDNYIDRGHRLGIPVSFSVLTAIRDREDPVQRESEREDVRSMQWYADNEVARGWWTHSRYARKARAVQEAYIRELGRVLANRMARYPEILVAASGDGEVELAYGREHPVTKEKTIYADYSPFTIAEFRDWLRHGGLYAQGQPYAGQGHALGSRYAGDRTPGEDTNNDGHTLNGDFGTSFTTWRLLHFDWDLADSAEGFDPHAVPLSAYTSRSFKRFPRGTPGGFDAPREPRTGQGNPWWDTWVLFKQTLLQHHNTDFARWVTTSPDPETGATVPATRWYSYQIPSDYAFSGSPDAPTERFLSSMSAWWTGDVSPYGGVGITAFNLDWSRHTPPSPITYTLRNVAPRIAERNLRWGIIEWNPGMLPFSAGVTDNPEIYAQELDVVERYRPSLVQPFAWGDPVSRVQDSGFEVMLRDLVARINRSPAPAITVDRPAVRAAAVPGGAATPPQPVELGQTGWARVAWRATSSESWLRVSPASGKGSGRLDIQIDASDRSLKPGAEVTGRVTVTAPDVKEPVVVDVTAAILAPGSSKPPFGLVATPAQGAGAVAGVIGVTGWVLDDVGVTSVKVYRNCLPIDRQDACQTLAGARVVLVGEASLQPGVRPDVEGAFATLPQAHKAGWGYLLKTTELPDVGAGRPMGGRGEVTLYVIATDAEGQTTLLGRDVPDHTPTRITLANPK